MKKLITKRLTLLCILSLLVIPILGYKLAGKYSLYPNDWFLPYTAEAECYEEKTRSYRFCCKYSELSQFRPYLNDFSKISENQIRQLRNNPSRVAYILRLKGKKYFLKKYRVTSLFHWIKRGPFRSSQAYRSWYYGHELLKLNILTPKPIAFYEEKVGPFWKNTYIVMEYIEIEEPLQVTLKKHPEIIENLIVPQIKAQLSALKKSSLIHSDYGVRNCLINKEKLYIFDLDDLHRYGSANSFFTKKFKKKHIKKLEIDFASTALTRKKLKSILNESSV